MSHPDILDERDPIGKPLAGSLGLHACVLAAFYLLWNFRPSAAQFGEQKVSPGSIGVNVVKSIPIPSKDGRENRLANDTQSVVPQAPPQKKEIAKVLPPDPKSVPIPSRNPKKIAQEQSRQNLYKPQPYKPNQVYSHTAEALKSPNFDMQGNNGIGIGQNSTLGTRFGYYVDLMRSQIARKWNTAGLAGDTRRVLVTFTIQRDGTVSDAKIAQASGNYTLDSSALRAVLEASPLPQLPAGFEKSSAPVELWFQAKQ